MLPALPVARLRRTMTVGTYVIVAGSVRARQVTNRSLRLRAALPSHPPCRKPDPVRRWSGSATGPCSRLQRYCWHNAYVVNLAAQAPHQRQERRQETCYCDAVVSLLVRHTSYPSRKNLCPSTSTLSSGAVFVDLLLFWKVFFIIIIIIILERNEILRVFEMLDGIALQRQHANTRGSRGGRRCRHFD